MVFLDLNMPGMDGFEALSAIRQLPNCRDVPIILYSTAMDRANQRKGMGLGATSCIGKQGSIKALTDTLSGILSGGAAANI